MLYRRIRYWLVLSKRVTSGLNMKKDKMLPWRRILLEGTAIVLSILLAFWIDAWWDDRQQQDNEEILLRSLVADLQQKQARLASNRQLTERMLDSCTKLLKATETPDQMPGEESIDKLLGDLTWYMSESQWDSAPMNSLTRGGESSLISDAVLLQKLAALQVRISRIRNSFRADENLHHNTLAPFLMQNANLLQIVTAFEHVPSDESVSYQFPKIQISDPREHSQLLLREDFQGLVVLKMDLHINMREFDYPFLEDQLAEVISLLEAELAK